MAESRRDPDPLDADFVIVGTGAAALVAALLASVKGLSVVVVEKTDRIGGTSAMSGAAAWVPANHLARAAGIEDSAEQALEYLRATAPAGWRETEDALWRGFVANAPEMLEFVEAHTPLRFSLTDEPDVFAELPGGKVRGRMVSTRPLSGSVAGPFARRMRRSTMPHRFTYLETTVYELYREPVRTVLRLAPRLAWRYLTGARAKGSALMAGLVGGCLAHGCRIVPETRALELLTDAHGAVTGVAVEQGATRRRFRARRGVLLATGGFEWDPALVSEHFAGPRGIPASPRSNDGDAIRLGVAVGATLAHMDQALIFPGVPTVYEGKLHTMPLPFHVEPNAIIVNRDARRFASEFFVDLGEALDRRDPSTRAPINVPAWFVSDARLRRPVLRWYARHVPGWIRRAPTLEALARATGLPPGSLVETVRRYNRFCETGSDEDFGRGETISQRFKSGGRTPLEPIARPPFVAMPLDRCIVATKGGLRTDALGRVVHREGHVIPGLYCAGAAMANPIGTRAISAGTTIGPNMTWGYICAKTLLANRMNEAREA
jgi:3-oxosteroid 1-dehydrogenase